MLRHSKRSPPRSAKITQLNRHQLHSTTKSIQRQLRQSQFNFSQQSQQQKHPQQQQQHGLKLSKFQLLQQLNSFTHLPKSFSFPSTTVTRPFNSFSTSTHHQPFNSFSSSTIPTNLFHTFTQRQFSTTPQHQSYFDSFYTPTLSISTLNATPIHFYQFKQHLNIAEASQLQMQQFAFLLVSQKCDPGFEASLKLLLQALGSGNGDKAQLQHIFSQFKALIPPSARLRYASHSSLGRESTSAQVPFNSDLTFETDITHQLLLDCVQTILFTLETEQFDDNGNPIEISVETKKQLMSEFELIFFQTLDGKKANVSQFTQNCIRIISEAGTGKSVLLCRLAPILTIICDHYGASYVVTYDSSSNWLSFQVLYTPKNQNQSGYYQVYPLLRSGSNPVAMDTVFQNIPTNSIHLYEARDYQRRDTLKPGDRTNADDFETLSYLNVMINEQIINKQKLDPNYRCKTYMVTSTPRLFQPLAAEHVPKDVGLKFGTPSLLKVKLNQTLALQAPDLPQPNHTIMQIPQTSAQNFQLYPPAFTLSKQHYNYTDIMNIVLKETLTNSFLQLQPSSNPINRSTIESFITTINQLDINDIISDGFYSKIDKKIETYKTTPTLTETETKTKGQFVYPSSLQQQLHSEQQYLKLLRECYLIILDIERNSSSHRRTHLETNLRTKLQLLATIRSNPTLTSISFEAVEKSKKKSIADETKEAVEKGKKGKKKSNADNTTKALAVMETYVTSKIELPSTQFASLKELKEALMTHFQFISKQIKFSSALTSQTPSFGILHGAQILPLPKRSTSKSISKIVSKNRGILKIHHNDFDLFTTQELVEQQSQKLLEAAPTLRVAEKQLGEFARASVNNYTARLLLYKIVHLSLNEIQSLLRHLAQKYQKYLSTQFLPTTQNNDVNIGLLSLQYDAIMKLSSPLQIQINEVVDLPINIGDLNNTNSDEDGNIHDLNNTNSDEDGNIHGLNNTNNDDDQSSRVNALLLQWVDEWDNAQLSALSTSQQYRSFFETKTIPPQMSLLIQNPHFQQYLFPFAIPLPSQSLHKDLSVDTLYATLPSYFDDIRQQIPRHLGVRQITPVSPTLSTSPNKTTLCLAPLYHFTSLTPIEQLTTGIPVLESNLESALLNGAIEINASSSQFQIYLPLPQNHPLYNTENIGERENTEHFCTPTVVSILKLDDEHDQKNVNPRLTSSSYNPYQQPQAPLVYTDILQIYRCPSISTSKNYPITATGIIGDSKRDAVMTSYADSLSQLKPGQASIILTPFLFSQMDFMIIYRDLSGRLRIIIGDFKSVQSHVIVKVPDEEVVRNLFEIQLGGQLEHYQKIPIDYFLLINQLHSTVASTPITPPSVSFTQSSAIQYPSIDLQYGCIAHSVYQPYGIKH